MKVLVVNYQEVQQWLPMTECVDAMVDVFKMLNRDKAVNPLRNIMWLPDKSGLIGMMPAYLGDTQVMGLKAISVFPEKTSRKIFPDLESMHVKIKSVRLSALISMD